MPRNSSGTYSLPAGNPVVPNTLIETNWANPTMSDIGSALTDSLDRYGRGGMLAQLKLADGTQAVPAFGFNAEASTGLYRASAGTLNVSVLGTIVASLTTAGVAITGTLSAGALSVASLVVAGSVSVGGVLSLALGTAALPSLAFTGDPNTGIYSPGADQWGVSTAGASRVVVSATGNVGMPNADTVARLRLDANDPTRGILAVVRNALSTTGAQIQISQSGVGDWAFGVVPAVNAFAIYAGRTIAVDGNERLRLDSAGNLGLGSSTGLTNWRILIANALGQGSLGILSTSLPTGAPSDRLGMIQFGAVGEATGAGSRIAAFGTAAWTTGTSTPSDIRFSTTPVGSITQVERVWIDSAGNVGIGAASGGERLSVTGTARIAGGTGTVSSLVLTGGASNFQFNHTSGSGVAQIANSAGTLAFAAGGVVTQMQLSGAGNVGLGVAPLASVRLMANTATNRNVAILDQGSTATVTALTDAGSSASLRVMGNLLVFGGDGSNEQMRLTSAGTLIINRTTDSGLGRLQVSGNADIAPSSGNANLYVRSVATANATLELSGNAIAAGSGLSLIHDNTGIGYLYNRQNAGLVFGTNNNAQMTLSSTGVVTPQTDAAQNFGGPTNRWATAFATGLSDGATASRMLVNSSGTTVQLAAGSAWQTLSFITNNTQKLVITSDGRLYGTALHNNAGAVTGTTNQYVASGTYTPTFANSSNVTGFSGISSANWIRVGNIVHVAGAVTVDITTAGVTTNWTATLPIASGVLNGDLHGVAVMNTAPDATATIFNGTNVALFSISSPVNNSTHPYRYMFTYEVV